MALILDTSFLIAVERELMAGKPPRIELTNKTCAIAAITLSELLLGVQLSSESKRAARVAQYNRMISGVSVLPFTQYVAVTHAELSLAVRKAGKPVGAHDLLIAATAVHHKLEIVTLDQRSFPLIPGIKLAMIP